MAESIQRPGGRRAGRMAWALLACAVAGIWTAPLAAHEIPASVVIQTFARPAGSRFRLLVRLPLLSIRDFVIPSKDGVLLDAARVQPMLADMARTWLIPSLTLLEDGQPAGVPQIVAARIALPSDRSFASYEDAIAHFRDPPLDSQLGVPMSGALLDVSLEYPIHNARAQFSVDPQFARFGIRVVTTMRFLMPDQPERAFQFTGDPGIVQLDPRWYQAALRFVHAGFAHILDGIDHLLFLFCLLLPLRRFWELVKVVTAFTVAHSVTLFCAAFGIVPDAIWFPPLIETLIAVSIVYMAIENIVVIWSGGSGGPALRRRWAIAFGFGLVHGFGFSFALRETLQFAGSHLVTSLVSFNVGVELGQLLVLAIVLPALALIFRFVVEARVGIIIASALVAHTAWHWMMDRGALLRQYDWSLSGPASLAALLRWLMVLVGVVGLVWVVSVLRRYKSSR